MEIGLFVMRFCLKKKKKVDTVLVLPLTIKLHHVLAYLCIKTGHGETLPESESNNIRLPAPLKLTNNTLHQLLNTVHKVIQTTCGYVNCSNIARQPAETPGSQ